jgi:hypothetical protein
MSVHVADYYVGLDRDPTTLMRVDDLGGDATELMINESSEGDQNDHSQHRSPQAGRSARRLTGYTSHEATEEPSGQTKPTIDQS